MDYAALKVELETDPDTIGYEGTGADIPGDVALLNSLATGRTKNIDRSSASSR